MHTCTHKHTHAHTLTRVSQALGLKERFVKRDFRGRFERPERGSMIDRSRELISSSWNLARGRALTTEQSTRMPLHTHAHTGRERESMFSQMWLDSLKSQKEYVELCHEQKWQMHAETVTTSNRSFTGYLLKSALITRLISCILLHEWCFWIYCKSDASISDTLIKLNLQISEVKHKQLKKKKKWYKLNTGVHKPTQAKFRNYICVV